VPRYKTGDRVEIHRCPVGGGVGDWKWVGVRGTGGELFRPHRAAAARIARRRNECAIHCNETAAAFVVSWYTAGILLPGLVGALIGPRVVSVALTGA
jgi:hypothetical protein